MLFQSFVRNLHKDSKKDYTLDVYKRQIEGEALRERFEADVKSFPVRVKTLSGWVTLRPNPNFAGASDGRTLRIGIFRPAIMAEAFLGATSIEPISKMTTIARITMSDTQRQRAEDYMNELIRVYNEDANEVKNEVALKTEAFVNKRIKLSLIHI